MTTAAVARQLVAPVGPLTDAFKRLHLGDRKEAERRPVPTQSSPPPAIPANVLDFFKDQSFWPSVPQLRPQHPAAFYQVLYARPETKDPEAPVRTAPDSADPRLKWLFIRTVDIAHDILMREFRDPIVKATQEWNASPSTFQGQQLYKAIFDQKLVAPDQQGRFPTIPKKPGNLGVCVPLTTLNAILDKEMTAWLKDWEAKKPGPFTIAEIGRITRLVLKESFHPELKVLEWVQENTQRKIYSAGNPGFYSALYLQIFQQIAREVDPRITRAIVYKEMKDFPEDVCESIVRYIGHCLPLKIEPQTGPTTTRSW